jgi:hypothetical protein
LGECLIDGDGLKFGDCFADAELHDAQLGFVDDVGFHEFYSPM